LTRTSKEWALLGLAAALAGCAPTLPPIMASDDKGTSYVTRISAQYPPGSSGQDLIDELQSQGFEVRLIDEPWQVKLKGSVYYHATKVLPILMTNCIASIEWLPDGKANIKVYKEAWVGCAWL
jgi:hypothetical protein